MKAKLDYIESRLQNLIEKGLTLLLPGGNPQQSLTRLLVETMQTNLVTTADGMAILAPDNFFVSIHPSRLPYWQEQQLFLDNLSRELYQAGSEVGFRFLDNPHIVILTDATLSIGQIKITATTTNIAVQETSQFSISVTPSSHGEVETIPKNAFLIVNGQEHFSLNQKVINIGRRLDNHLVIDDPRVSRNHVQLRAVNGRYVIFDLNASGGTYVNGQRISQETLNPGDVISLAGYPLIYGQDMPHQITNTQNISITSPDKPDSSDPNIPA